MSIKQPSCLDVANWQGCSDVSAQSCWCRIHAIRAAERVGMSRQCMATKAQESVPLVRTMGATLAAAASTAAVRAL